jgi:phage terminase large subunit-like protein
MNARSSIYLGGGPAAADPDDFGPALEELARIGDPDELAYRVGMLPGPVQRRIWDAWYWKRFDGQREPEGDWRVWLMMGGRGFGKTRVGAEWVWARTREVKGAEIALVGGTIDEVVQVMVEGESGLISAARTGESARWVASRRRVEFSNGALAFAYSAEKPEKLRGPQHHFAWCDELGKWPATGSGQGTVGRGEKAWDNLQMTMRLGTRPRIVVTTTPRSTALVRRVRDEAGEAGVTRGRMEENWTLPECEVAAVTALYAGTRLGRQEIGGELLEDVAGALFSRELLEKARCSGPVPMEWMKRIVIGVDPPASAEGDACGIVVCGLGADGVGYVLADCSVGGLSPEGWARKVAAAAEAWGADRVVAEKNQGGAMVESVLRAARERLPLKLVHAAEAKAARAEPVATLFESKRAKLAGSFPELEDELAGLTMAGGYERTGRGGRSPDRADAMVHAMAELMLRAPAAEPRVRAL